MTLKEITQKIEIMEANRTANLGILHLKQNKLNQIESEISILEKSGKILQSFLSSVEHDIINRFENLISSGVKEVFEKNYEIKIVFSNTQNNINADFIVRLPDGKEVNIYEGEGGGLKDFISVLQRILYIILEPNRPDKILFLDENLKHLDATRAIKAFNFIRKLTKELDVQILFITHLDILNKISMEEDDNIIEVSNINGQSIINHITLK